MRSPQCERFPVQVASAYIVLQGAFPCRSHTWLVTESFQHARNSLIARLSRLRLADVFPFMLIQRTERVTRVFVTERLLVSSLPGFSSGIAALHPTECRKFSCCLTRHWEVGLLMRFIPPPVSLTMEKVPRSKHRRPGPSSRTLSAGSPAATRRRPPSGKGPGWTL